ncbi:hypothetical protein [Halodesulfurarchaeum sp.]|uniref:hypothetical protein n=1 Tax=Halodesulfurarchaeum sp. TaxID=1980530 RepID=UPI002FC2AA2D
MDLGRLLYVFARVYVWALLAVGLVTVFALLLPVKTIDATQAGVMFAVGGFGGLVSVIAVMIYLYD